MTGSLAARLAVTGVLAASAVAVAHFGAPLGATSASGVVSPTLHPSPLIAIPATADAVLELDLTRLRRTEIGRELLRADRELPGIGRVAARCGFDPSAELTGLAIGLVPSQRGSEPVIVATGALTAERLTQCAVHVLEERGGQARTEQVGAFALIRDTRAEREGVLAIREGGPAVLAPESLLGSVLAAAEARAPNVGEAPLHRALRAELGADGVVVLTWALPEGWVSQVLEGDPAAKRSPLAAARALAARVEVEPRVALELVVGCQAPEPCARLAGELRRMERDLLAPLLRQTTGLELGERVRVELGQRRLRISLELEPHEARRLVTWLAEEWAK